MRERLEKRFGRKLGASSNDDAASAGTDVAGSTPGDEVDRAARLSLPNADTPDGTTAPFSRASDAPTTASAAGAAVVDDSDNGERDDVDAARKESAEAAKYFSPQAFQSRRARSHGGNKIASEDSQSSDDDASPDQSNRVTQAARPARQRPTTAPSPRQQSTNASSEIDPALPTPAVAAWWAEHGFPSQYLGSFVAGTSSTTVGKVGVGAIPPPGDVDSVEYVPWPPTCHAGFSSSPARMLTSALWPVCDVCCRIG